MARSRSLLDALVTRARLVLMAAEGMPGKLIAGSPCACGAGATRRIESKRTRRTESRPAE